MEKRYQVFISSTYEDLQEERKAVSDTLLSMDCIPVGMEEFPATDEEQFEFIKRIIDESDYYLLIIGGRYGSICNDGVSFTEKEFDYAVSKKKTVISFIHVDRDKLTVDKTDKDDYKKQKLEQFIAKVSSGRLKKDWKNKDELRFLVAQSISYAKKTSPAVGYVRANLPDMEELLNQLNKLRMENEDLKKKLSERDTSLINIPNIAQIDEEYEFNGIEYLDINTNREYSVRDNWLDVFLILSPKAMEGLDDSSSKATLNRYFARKLGVRNFSLDEISFNTIKIQFIALGLFDSDGFWQLTDKGKKLLLLNGAVRSSKIN